MALQTDLVTSAMIVGANVTSAVCCMRLIFGNMPFSGVIFVTLQALHLMDLDHPKDLNKSDTEQSERKVDIVLHQQQAQEYMTLKQDLAQSK